MSQGATKVIIIKKKAKGHGHHGGAWKVAYADFVTAMMALFIVLWLLTQTDTASRSKIAQYFRTGVLPGGSMVAGRPSGSNPPVGVDMFPEGTQANKAGENRELEALKKDVEKAIKGDGTNPEMQDLLQHVSVKLVDDGALIELVDGGDSFLFPVGSTSLKPIAVQLLQKLAPLLASTDHKLEIHGHTDSRPYDPKAGKTNWDLSYERANAARQVLEGYGLPAGKINAVLAHGDSALKNKKDPYAPENRRLAILVVRPSRERERSGNAPDPKAGDQADKAPAAGGTPAQSAAPTGGALQKAPSEPHPHE